MTAEARTEGFEGWAVLELMGHRRLGGFCCETRIAGAEMIRIDIPWKDPSKGNRLTQFYADEDPEDEGSLGSAYEDDAE